jgi:hypothetical protein
MHLHSIRRKTLKRIDRYQPLMDSAETTLPIAVVPKTGRRTATSASHPVVGNSQVADVIDKLVIRHAQLMPLSKFYQILEGIWSGLSAIGISGWINFPNGAGRWHDERP